MLTTIFYIFMAIIVLLIMITIHEFGHYYAGKKLGFKIKEFSVGFGKKIYSKKLENGELFSLRMIPLGGYCAFEGHEDTEGPSGFNNQKPWKRIIVLSAGAIFNILSAIVFAAIFLLFVGYDIPQVTVIGDAENNPNYGTIQVGDIITGVNDVDIDFTKGNMFPDLIADFEANETFNFNIIRDGEEITITVQKYNFEHDGQTSAILGIGLDTVPYNLWDSIIKSFALVYLFASQILVFLLMLFTGMESFSNVGGPVATISIIASFAQQSFSYLLFLMPIIAVNLAVFNLLPIPALDGTRIVFVFIEWIRGKPINRNIEGWIHFGGLIFLLALVIFADVLQFIR